VPRLVFTQSTLRYAVRSAEETTYTKPPQLTGNNRTHAQHQITNMEKCTDSLSQHKLELHYVIILQ